MEIFRTKLYQYFPGDEVTEKEMIEHISQIFQKDPDNENIVYVVESDKEGYVREISTGVLLPVFKGDKLVYRDDYVDSEIQYYEGYYWHAKKIKKNVRTRTSVPTHILEFQDKNIKDCFAGVPSLELYANKAGYHDTVQYIEKYSGVNDRYQYLCRQLYNTDYIDSYNVEELKKLRADINLALRKSCHIFSNQVYSPFTRGKIYSVYPSFLEDDKKLPLEVSISSDDDVGFELYRQLPLHDFDMDDTIIKRLFVTLGRDGHLREIRTKKIIPLVYYLFDDNSKKARLMIDGREATENEQISFFVFMPSVDEFQLGDKEDIRFYKRYYLNFESILNSYLSTNQVSSSKGKLKDVPKAISTPVNNDFDSNKDKKDSQDTSFFLAFDGSTFSKYLPQILKVRNMILSMDSNPLIKEQYLSKLNSILNRYDSDIKKLQDSVLTLQDESSIQNHLLKELTDIEANLSIFGSSDNYQWVSPYLEFLECDSSNLYDNFKSLYYFSLDFQRKAMDNSATLLQSLKAQKEIDEALFFSLLRLNGVEQASAILLLNDSTVERLATVVDNHIDKVSETDGDITVVNSLKNYNEEKSLNTDKDISFLRNYLTNAIADYSQLEVVKVLGKVEM